MANTNTTNKETTAPQLNGAANEKTIAVNKNSRNNTTGRVCTLAKPKPKNEAKAKARAARRKAKKLTKNGGELIPVKFGNKKTNFYFIEGINLSDFLIKNKDVAGLSTLSKEHQKDLLNRVHNQFALTTGRFESIKVGKANAKWSREDGQYRAFVSLQGKLRREAFDDEKIAALAKDKAKMLAAYAEREASLKK